MPTYKNFKPSVIGLNHDLNKEARLINPGEVFEANASDIPKGLLDAGWVRTTNEKPIARANAPVAAQPGLGSGADNPNLVGVPDSSPTDAQSAAVAPVPQTSAAERSAATRDVHLVDDNKGVPDSRTPITPDAGASSSSSTSTPSTAPSGLPSSDDDTKTGKKHK
jgi:hypothetical protein